MRTGCDVGRAVIGFRRTPEGRRVVWASWLAYVLSTGKSLAWVRLIPVARLTDPPAPAYLRLLDGPESAPRVAGDGLRAAARPEAPRAPSAPSRAVLAGGLAA